jgi:2-polyprenyl-3-methyl-5-hydroxy-6-metoxy-1,4-benzoquinol methylase
MMPHKNSESMGQHTCKNDNSYQEPIGRATMSSGIAEAVNYHRYLYSQIRPFLQGMVWEIGCGYGQYTRFLLDENFRVLATDIDSNLLSPIQQNLAAAVSAGSLVVEKADLYCLADLQAVSAYKPNSIVCLNVLEHIKDDVECLSRIRQVVKSGTVAVFLCPAHPTLYGFMDSEAGHYRRYTRRSLSRAFIDAGWQIKRSFYLNPVGALGWFVRNRILPPSSGSLDDPKVNADIALFDRFIVPITRRLDLITKPFFGQSVVVVASAP